MMARPFILAAVTLLFELAYCDFEANIVRCSCPEGSYGNGQDCSTTSFAVRLVLEYDNAAQFDWDQVRARYIALLVTGESNGVVTDALRTMMWENAYVKWDQTKTVASVFGLFAGKIPAELAKGKVQFIDPLAQPDSLVLRTNIASIMGAKNLIKGPEVFAFVTGTTSDVIEIVPTGLEVTSVYFEPSCLASGCWVVEVIFTLGKDNFNALYLPKKVLKAEPVGDAFEEEYEQEYVDSFLPAQFPCQTFDFAGGATPWSGTACCIVDFLADFRPLTTFVDWATNSSQSDIDNESCPADKSTTDAPIYTSDNIPTTNHLTKSFENMTSYAIATGQVGEYTYSGTLYLDDLELRSSSAKMRGFPNIEYTLDFFVGLAEFKPTSVKAFDPFSKQVNIHVEATRFMTVAVHEYVGPRNKDICCGSECDETGFCPNGENVNCKIVFAPFADLDEPCGNSSCWCCGDDCDASVCPPDGDCEIRCTPEYEVGNDMCKPDYCCGKDCTPEGKCPAGGDCEVLSEPADSLYPCGPTYCCGPECTSDGKCPASSDCRVLTYSEVLNNDNPCAPQYCCGPDCTEDPGPVSCPINGNCQMRSVQPGEEETCAPQYCCGPDCRNDGSCPTNSPLDKCRIVTNPPNPLEPCAVTYCCGTECRDGKCPNGDSANCEIIKPEDWLANQTSPCELKYCCGPDCTENPVSCPINGNCVMKLVQDGVDCSKDAEKICCGPACRPDGSCPAGAVKPQCWTPAEGESCDPDQPCFGPDCDEKCKGDDHDKCCVGDDCKCNATSCECDGPDCCRGDDCETCTGPDCDNECLDWSDPACCRGDNCTCADGTCECGTGLTDCCIGPECAKCSGPECDSDCISAGSEQDQCCAGDDCSCECDGDDCKCECDGDSCCLGDFCDVCTGPDCDSDCDDWTVAGKCCIGDSCPDCFGPECDSDCISAGIDEDRCCAGADCVCKADKCECVGDNCCLGNFCDICIGPDCDSDCDDWAVAGKCCVGDGCSCTDTTTCTACAAGVDNCCQGPTCATCTGPDCACEDGDCECTGPECCFGDCSCANGDCTCDGDDSCCIGLQCNDCEGPGCDDICTGDNCCYGSDCEESCTGPGCDSDCGTNPAECCFGNCDCEDGSCECSGGACCIGDDCGGDCQGPDCSSACDDWTTGECKRGECTGTQDACCEGPSCLSCIGEDCDCDPVTGVCGCTGDACCFGDDCKCTSTGCTCPYGSGECCVGESCNACTGDDCEPVCIGDNCCFGDGCESTGDCSVNADSTCCKGTGCNDCKGTGCEKPECTMAGDCYVCDENSDDTCCAGEACNHCHGPGCDTPECDTSGDCCQGPSCAACIGPDCACDPDGDCECTGPDCCFGDGCDPDCKTNSEVCDTCLPGGTNCCVGLQCNDCEGPGCDDICKGENCCYGSDCEESCTGPGCDSDCGTNPAECCFGNCDCEDGSCECSGGACCIGSSCETCQGDDCSYACDDWTTGECARGNCTADDCCEGPSCLSCIGQDCNCDPGTGVCGCTGDACCFGDDCECGVSDCAPCPADSAECCVGESCNACTGDDCEPVCTGDNCCFGAGCAEVCTGGVCTPCPSGSSDCCTGTGCHDCEGRGCEDPECTMEGDCYVCDADSDYSCCSGVECNHCHGWGCDVQECKGDDCCFGEDCDCDDETCKECAAGKNCCEGEECNECTGEKCKNVCTGPECCHGAGCNCTSTECEECASEDDTCCKGESCDECKDVDGSGQCDEDCTGDCCSGSFEDCGCKNGIEPEDCEPACDEWDPKCCTGPLCDEQCTGTCCPGSTDECCSADTSCECTSSCCPGSSGATDACCGEDYNEDDCEPPCEGACCDSEEACCDPAPDSVECCTGPCCDSTDDCCDPTGEDQCACEGDCCPGSDDECCGENYADECDKCTGRCCDSEDSCCEDPNAAGCCVDPSGCCDPEATCCGDDYVDASCCDGDCCAGDQECCAAVGKQCCEDEDGCCDGEEECNDPRDETMVTSVNARIFEVLGRTEAGEMTNDPSFQYVQVVITFAGWADAHEITGVFPLNSILVGQGARRSSTQMMQACAGTGAHWEVQAVKDSYEALVTNQTYCAPDADMCVSPGALSIVDKFAFINIPFPRFDSTQTNNQAGYNLFVESVITLVDRDRKTSKTKFSLRVPIVEAGTNLWCKRLEDQTDLQEVLNVDLWVGTADSASELTRLRLFEDIANSVLTPQNPTTFNTDSIESGLMTLVLKGNPDYFTRSGTQAFSVEVEDLVTIHIMEPATTTAKYTAVLPMLLAGSGAGGAFTVTIDRIGARAQLDPSPLLLSQCSVLPSRPTLIAPLPETCIIRRDIQNRAFPTRLGSFPTAMEITPQFTSGTSDVRVFMENIFGGSNYSSSLADSFVGVMRDRYGLGTATTPNTNNRYTRAFWINPGYEWTPTQTGGRSIFSVSQRILMFVLVGIDEGVDYGSTDVTGARRSGVRRQILQVNVEDKSKGSSTQNFQFNTNAEKVICPTVPEACTCGSNKDELCEHFIPKTAAAAVVSWFKVTKSISVEAACTPAAGLQAELQAEMEGFMSLFGQGYESVAILDLAVALNGATCPAARRADGEPAATYTAQVTFKAGEAGTVDLEKIAKQAGIQSISCTAGCTAAPGGKTIDGGGKEMTGAASGLAGFSSLLLALLGAALALLAL